MAWWTKTMAPWVLLVLEAGCRQPNPDWRGPVEMTETTDAAETDQGSGGSEASSGVATGEPSCAESGQSRCSGICVDLRVDATHCGGCETPCGPTQTCTSGACRCLNPTRTLCSGECVNLSTDAMHCGQCGRACGDNAMCLAGNCVSS